MFHDARRRPLCTTRHLSEYRVRTNWGFGGSGAGWEGFGPRLATTDYPEPYEDRDDERQSRPGEHGNPPVLASPYCPGIDPAITSQKNIRKNIRDCV